ncbi:MAG TPA: hypothetical protein VJ456_06740 [Acidimicrobiia bacterium]|nr:hypothetical protein [Acidimicrobiia bacterium]
MAYCGPRGIPHSVFLGRVVGPDDPQWLPSDREDAMAWSAHEARRCKHCGTHPEEWAEDGMAYHAHMTACRGCRQLQRLQNSKQAQEAGDGRSVVMAGGSAAHCKQCKPV